MIRTETVTINGRDFVHTWSDAGRYIVRDGITYSDARDPAELGRTYTEGDPIDDTDATPEDYEEALAELGVNI